MKLYISADIEGVCGVTSWSETELDNRESGSFIIEWIKEIQKVIDVAIEQGYDDIYLKDAHDTARNLLPEFFPKEVRLIRGWSGHPYGMVEGIDSTFDAAIFVGFHSRAGSNTNPISHTLYPKYVRSMCINGEPASEFLIYYYTCCYANVPVIMVVGDKGICQEVNNIDKDIFTVITKEGFGGATINCNPKNVLDEIREKTELSIQQNIQVKQLPITFDIEVNFVKHVDAFKASFYKDAVADEDGYTIRYRSKDFFDILRFFSFVLG
ncbi:MAG: hypothetical protein CVU84_04820 [Firmicutes bacterium HGW-Firmicutes-1]|jgi:D-amino peptidase|nr:MAG: hypothetical protein CVU84_04820 [Firmicutes bacterium HGW-Firmicutes-1]